MKLISLTPVRRGDWVLKASVFDDQILIFLWNEYIMESRCEVFYSEDMAYYFIERICNDNSNCKANDR